MTNIARAPFFAPRPAEDQLWSNVPLSSNIISKLTQQLSLNLNTSGVSQSYYKAEDKLWVGTPKLNNTINQLIQQISLNLNTVSQIYFAKKNHDHQDTWQFKFAYDQALNTSTSTSSNIPGGVFYYPKPDDQSSWQFEFEHNQPLNVATPATPKVSRQPSFFAEDSTIWPGALADGIFPVPLLITLGPSTLIPVGSFFVPNYNDASNWTPWKNRNLTAYGIPSTKPFVNNYKNLIDDSAIWQQPPQRSIGLPFVPPIEDRYRLDIADDQLWARTTQRDLPLNAVSPSPITSRQSSFFNDDSAIWQGSPTLSKTLSKLDFAPTVPRQWLFGYDDPAFWLGTPIDSAPIPMLTVGGIIKAKQWHWDNDDPSMWSGWENRNLVSIVTVVAPFIPVFYRFNADDPAIWQQPPQRSIALPLLPPIQNRYQLGMTDDQLWALTVQRNPSTLNTISVSPITSRQSSFFNDDQAFWLGQPVRATNISMLTVGGIIKAKQWNANRDDPQLWAGWENRNLINTVTVTNPFITNSFPFKTSYSIDDFPVWQSPLNQNLYFVAPVVGPNLHIVKFIGNVGNMLIR